MSGDRSKLLTEGDMSLNHIVDEITKEEHLENSTILEESFDHKQYKS